MPVTPGTLYVLQTKLLWIPQLNYHLRHLNSSSNLPERIKGLIPLKKQDKETLVNKIVTLHNYIHPWLWAIVASAYIFSLHPDVGYLIFTMDKNYQKKSQKAAATESLPVSCSRTWSWALSTITDLYFFPASFSASLAFTQYGHVVQANTTISWEEIISFSSVWMGFRDIKCRWILRGNKTPD